MHRALAEHGDDDPDFAPEPITSTDLAQWRGELEEAAQAMLGRIERVRAEPARAGAGGGRRRARRPRRRCSTRSASLAPDKVDRGQDPPPWRLPPRPGYRGAERFLHHRFRGRARPADARAAAQEFAVARCRRHDPLVRLRRDQRRCGRSPRPGRRRCRASGHLAETWRQRAVRRLPRRLSQANARLCPPTRRTKCRAARWSISSRWKRRSTRSSTNWRTGRDGIRSTASCGLTNGEIACGARFDGIGRGLAAGGSMPCLAAESRDRVACRTRLAATSRRSSPGGTATRSPFSACTRPRSGFMCAPSCPRRTRSRSIDGAGGRSSPRPSASTRRGCSSPRWRTAASRSAIGCGRAGAAHQHEFDDVYRFPPVLGELDIHLLVEGNHLASYRKLGAHPVIHDGVEGVAFAVWAPNARRVSVVGEFNDWDGRRMPMRRRHAGGFWEIFVPGLRPGHLYKYEIVGAGWRAVAAEGRPACRAIGASAGHRLGGRRAVAPRLAGRRLDGRALASITTARRRSRSTKCISARGAAIWPSRAAAI